MTKSLVSLLFLILLCGAGCKQPPAPPPDQINAGLQVTLQTLPLQPKQMDATKFTVRLTDAQVRMVSGASVTIDLDMPGMDMGQNDITATPQSAGIYVGTGRFTMPGPWQATVTAVKSAAKTRKSFPVNVQ